MKKTYIKPTMNVYQLRTTSVIATSIGDGKLGGGVSSDGGTDDNGYNENQFSRRWSGWGKGDE